MVSLKAVQNIGAPEFKQQRLAVDAAKRLLPRYKNELEGLSNLLDAIADSMADDFNQPVLITAEDVQQWESSHSPSTEEFYYRGLSIKATLNGDEDSPQVEVSFNNGAVLPHKTYIPMSYLDNNW